MLPIRTMSIFPKNIICPTRKYRCFSKCCSSGSKPTKPVDPCSTYLGPKKPSESNKYDTRKFSHNLPTNDRSINFEGFGDIPKGVFRDTTGEKLGPGSGADKNGSYLNVEYFSFHHMSFYDMHVLLRKYRRPCPKSGRKL